MLTPGEHPDIVPYVRDEAARRAIDEELAQVLQRIEVVEIRAAAKTRGLHLAYGLPDAER